MYVRSNTIKYYKWYSVIYEQNKLIELPLTPVEIHYT